MAADKKVVTAARVQKPFQVSFEQVEVPPPGEGQVLLEVLACGVCGYDLEIAGQLAEKPTMFGHEISGRVAALGPGVGFLEVGQVVALESSTLCGVCARCRDGRAGLCRHSVSFWGGPSMGFSEAMLTPARSCVPADGLSAEAAMLGEPAAVAVDMVHVAEIGPTDRVLIVGTGAIGLMVLGVVRRLTAGPVVCAARSSAKLAVAAQMGAETVDLRTTPLAECGAPWGGFDRVLVMAPPCTLPDCLRAADFGGIVVFIGYDWGPGGTIEIETTPMHMNKQQLRSANNGPNLYMPEALELVRRDVIPAGIIVTHRFPLSRLAEALALKREEPAALKIAVIPDALFTEVQS